MRQRKLLSMTLGLALSLPIVLAETQTAQADVTVKVRGRAHLNAGVRVRVRPRHTRRPRVRRPRVVVRTPHVTVRSPRVYVPPTPRTRVRLRIGGGVSFGYTRFAQPPPPPPGIDCEAPPTYAPTPVYTPPPPPVAAVAERRAPRFGIGGFVGQTDADHVRGHDLGLMARFRLTRSLHLEGEVSRTEHADSARVDRRVGAGLMFDVMPASKLSPQLVGAIGVNRADMGGATIDQEYAEVGVGLTYRLTDRVSLSADLRAGARMATSEEDVGAVGVAMKQIAPPADEEESYTRARLAAILRF